ncbi:MAG TPA: AraC family transcriptional regulator, partial [Clostridia bacterium]|nr:AraC family transcriptional regulator [Clostridia bacterium]
GVPHSLIVEKDTTCRMLNIEFKFAKSNTPCLSIKDLNETVPVFSSLMSLAKPYLVLRDPEEIYPSLRSLIMELDEKQGSCHIMVHLLFGQILIGISRLAYEKLYMESSVGSIHIKKALHYLHQYYDQDIKIGDLADKLNIHEGYLYRIFKEHTDITPIEYLTRLRIEKAKMLLTRTDIPIIEISGYVGINSRQYFTYLFKKHTATTPAQYRNSIDKFEGFK